LKEVVTEFKEGKEAPRPKARPKKPTARTPKREPLVCVLVRSAASGKKITFEWNYFEELSKNERVLNRYESLVPFIFNPENEPAWYKDPIPDLPAE
jgi:hypothetical protein